MKYILIAICFFCTANVMAQNDDGGDAEYGMELTSELQATDRGDYNCANLLRLYASLPVSSNVSFEAASLSTYMTASESIGGDMQTFSNLDAGNILFALSVCGVSWTYTSTSRESRRVGSHSLFLGIRNMNEDYFTSPVTSFFTNSSCGIYPTISANYPIANYPVASVGVHYRYENVCEDEGRGFAVQASLYNGTGHNRFTGRDNVFRICPKDDGVCGIAEVSYSRGGSYYSLGNALYCNAGTSPSTLRHAQDQRKFRMNSTPWFYTEQSITPTLSLLTGCSHAFSTEAECRDFFGLGALYRLGRCHLGAFTDYANFKERKEYATELTCKIPISRNIDIQPTAHLITYDSTLHCVAMLRMALSL